MFIRDHINSIFRIESHYLRAQTSREFVDGSLNLGTLYRLYTEYCKERNAPVAKKSIYQQIFNTEFNITLFIPKKNQCALCANYLNSNEENKESLKIEYDQHLRNKNRAREEKCSGTKQAKNYPSILVAVYDLQDVFPTPSGNINPFFYKSKPNFFNFTIYNIPTKEGFCYLWNKAVALCGSNEIAT